MADRLQQVAFLYLSKSKDGRRGPEEERLRLEMEGVLI